MTNSTLKAGLLGLMIAVGASVAMDGSAQQSPSENALADGPRVPGP